MTRPTIGLTLDWEPPGGYSKLPWYALRENYCECVIDAGGAPVLLPHDVAHTNDYLGVIRALIVTGGAFDVDPSLFGAEERHASVTTKEARTAFELALTKEAVARDLPVLGICGGEQLLNVALGGTLYQHLPDEVADALEHEQKNSREEPGHRITIAKGTLLHRIAGVEATAVNSAHHQAVKDLAPGLIANAHTSDGVIEGIEHASARFCLGVQWHPEYRTSPIDSRIFAALIEAARRA
jgi:putative glutamine amidotransferase